ncbi:MAG: hypothetical protein N2510_02515 [Ignavibacteria bacterium]|nr:hypothetical protein [Ignavibacteria bacterium]
MSYSQDDLGYSSSDTSYDAVANSSIINMLKKGKAPVFTLQLSFNYNIGHLDLAANDNTYFFASDFISGRNFGTRYGYGANLTGKISLHSEGNFRLNVGTGFNRFQSNFIISASPEGKVSYNVISGSLGFENNFTPDRKFKPFIGTDFTLNLISGEATLTTDSTDFNLKIKNSLRFGASLNLGFEYAFTDNFGFHLGYKIIYANIVGKKSEKTSSNRETYLNDDKVSGSSEPIPYAGWKQFVYSSFYTGFNIYFSMKNKK